MSKQTFHGSCHCGAHRFEADVDLSKGTSKCNCTWCWKQRRWSLRVEVEDFRALSGDGELSKGRRGWCTTCGVRPYDWVAKAEWNDREYVSVNVAALDDLDPKALAETPVTFCDGRADNWWNPPAFTAHL
jgi:hypothetical protein